MSRSLQERFDAKYIPEPNSGCWLWTGALTGQRGYGSMYADGKHVTAHRISYLLHKGNIEDGLDICHTCDVCPCVNPDHLFKGTRAENMQDCVAKGRNFIAPSGTFRKYRFKHELKTHCPRGHVYDVENTYWWVDKDGDRHRHCKICSKIHKQTYRNKAR